jgi:ubiquitin carboxyl-terminal hydrolase 5/13
LVVNYVNSTVRFGTLPDVLLVHVRRFVCPDWVPIKLGTNVVISEGPIDFSDFVGTGLLPAETKMPDETAAAAPSAAFQPNPELLAQLTSMGFGDNACIRALKAVDNADAEQAMNWLFGHLDDADINLPLPDESTVSTGKAAVDPMALASLVSMGFAEDRCAYALEQTDGNAERAIDWLFSHADDPLPTTSAVSADVEMKVEEDANRSKSFKLIAAVTHLGQSTGFGHYVAHVWRAEESQWVYFNDSKVAASKEPPLSRGYLYVLKRLE